MDIARRFGKVLLIIFVVITLLPILGVLAEVEEPNSNSRATENADTYIFMDLEDNKKEILPGDSLIFEIIVRNLGTSTITYYPPSVNSLSIPKDWSLSFFPSTELILAPNFYGTLNVTLGAPIGAKANTLIELEIIGTTSDPNAVIIPAELSANVHEIFDISLNVENHITLESPLDPANFEVSIINIGNIDDRVELRIMDVPSGLELSLYSQEFMIPSGKTDSLTITMYPSSILTAGESKLNISLFRVNNAGKEWVGSHSLWVEVNYYPDLYISMGDIELSKYTPTSGENIKINITLHNLGDSDARDVVIKVTPITKAGSPLSEIDDINIELLEANESTMISIPWLADSPAVDRIKVELDPQDEIGELNEDNNDAQLHFTIIAKQNPNPSGDPNVGKYSLSQLAAVGVVTVLTCAIISVFGFYATTDPGKFAVFKLLIAPFYTRVKKEEVLNHEVRELVYDYVQTHPGEHFRAILTKLGLTNGTLIHHLQTLEKQEFIKSERDGPFKRFYPTGRQFTEDVLEINGIQKKILDEVTAQPGLTQKDLAMQLHASPPTINYHIKALRGVRLINIKRDGKRTRCFPGQSLNGWYKGGEVS